MNEIKIKEQTLPTRCEICHQSDCFDAINNSCSRCATVSIQAENKKAMLSNEININKEVRNIFIGGLVALTCLSLAIFIPKILIKYNLNMLPIASLVISLVNIKKGVKLLKQLPKLLIEIDKTKAKRFLNIGILINSIALIIYLSIVINLFLKMP